MLHMHVHVYTYQYISIIIICSDIMIENITILYIIYIYIIIIIYIYIAASCLVFNVVIQKDGTSLYNDDIPSLCQAWLSMTILPQAWGKLESSLF